MSRKQVGRFLILGEKYPIYEGMNIIGRDLEATVTLKHLKFSKRHAVISVIEDRHYLTDHNSINGTRLRGKKLEPFLFYRLNHKAIITMGDIVGTYYIESEIQHDSSKIIKKLPLINESAIIKSKEDTILLCDETINTTNQQMNISDVIIDESFNESMNEKVDELFVAATQEIDTQPITFLAPKEITKNCSVNEGTTSKDDDCFLVPTQVVATPSKRKRIEADFSAPTQLLNEKDDDPDDTFLAPTQMMETTIEKPIDGENVGVDEDCFDVATQKINEETTTEKPAENDDCFDVATQILNIDKPTVPNKRSNRLSLRRVDDDYDFLAPTQPLHNSTVDMDNNEDDYFMVSTQQLEENSVLKSGDDIMKNLSENYFVAETQEIESANDSMRNEDDEFFKMPTQVMKRMSGEGEKRGAGGKKEEKGRRAGDDRKGKERRGGVSKKDSKVSKTDSEVSKTDSEASKTDNEARKTDSEVSKTDSGVSKKDSEARKTDSVVSKTDSEVRKTDSKKDSLIDTKEPEGTQKNSQSSKNGPQKNLDNINDSCFLAETQKLENLPPKLPSVPNEYQKKLDKLNESVFTCETQKLEGYNLNTTGNNLNTTGNSPSTTGNDLNTTGNDLNTTENDLNTTRNDLNTTGNSLNTTGNGLNTNQESTNDDDDEFDFLAPSEVPYDDDADFIAPTQPLDSTAEKYFHHKEETLQKVTSERNENMTSQKINEAEEADKSTDSGTMKDSKNLDKSDEGNNKSTDGGNIENLKTSDEFDKSTDGGTMGNQTNFPDLDETKLNDGTMETERNDEATMKSNETKQNDKSADGGNMENPKSDETEGNNKSTDSGIMDKLDEKDEEEFDFLEPSERFNTSKDDTDDEVDFLSPTQPLVYKTVPERSGDEKKDLTDDNKKDNETVRIGDCKLDEDTEEIEINDKNKNTSVINRIIIRCDEDENTDLIVERSFLQNDKQENQSITPTQTVNLKKFFKLFTKQTKNDENVPQNSETSSRVISIQDDEDTPDIVPTQSSEILIPKKRPKAIPETQDSDSDIEIRHKRCKQITETQDSDSDIEIKRKRCRRIVETQEIRENLSFSFGESEVSNQMEESMKLFISPDMGKNTEVETQVEMEGFVEGNVAPTRDRPENPLVCVLQEEMDIGNTEEVFGGDGEGNDVKNEIKMGGVKSGNSEKTKEPEEMIENIRSEVESEAKGSKTEEGNRKVSTSPSPSSSLNTKKITPDNREVSTSLSPSSSLKKLTPDNREVSTSLSPSSKSTPKVMDKKLKVFDIKNKELRKRLEELEPTQIIVSDDDDCVEIISDNEGLDESFCNQETQVIGNSPKKNKEKKLKTQRIDKFLGENQKKYPEQSEEVGKVTKCDETNELGEKTGSTDSVLDERNRLDPLRSSRKTTQNETKDNPATSQGQTSRSCRKSLRLQPEKDKNIDQKDDESTTSDASTSDKSNRLKTRRRRSSSTEQTEKRKSSRIQSRGKGDGGTESGTDEEAPKMVTKVMKVENGPKRTTRYKNLSTITENESRTETENRPGRNVSENTNGEAEVEPEGKKNVLENPSLTSEEAGENSQKKQKSEDRPGTKRTRSKTNKPESQDSETDDGPKRNVKIRSRRNSNKPESQDSEKVESIEGSEDRTGAKRNIPRIRSTKPESQNSESEVKEVTESKRTSRSKNLNVASTPRTEHVSETSQNSSRTLSPSPFETPRKRQKIDEETRNRTPSTRNASRIKHKIVFTMLDDTNLEATAGRLGATIVNSTDQCTVLVTSKICRSLKFLTAVALHKPIVSPQWIVQSGKSHKFLDPWDFILEDEESEKKHGFKLVDAIKSNVRILEDYNIFLVTSKNADVLKSIVELNGGSCIKKLPTKMSKRTLAVAYEEDQGKYKKYLGKNPLLNVVAAEAIFEGCLKQKLDLEKYYLT